jgi:FkbM family methyltransferase
VKLDALGVDQHETALRLAKMEEKLSEQIADICQAGGAVFIARGGPYVIDVEGLLIALPSSHWRLAAQLTLKGFTDPGVMRLFRRLVRPGMVVVDAGAYVGQYTLEAARLLKGTGKVYSFEPNPQAFVWLRENIILNGFDSAETIELRQSALAGKKGIAFIHLCPDQPGSSTLLPEAGEESSVAVETVTMDEALKDESHVDVVRIDVDGAEGFVVEGMQRILAENPSLSILMRFTPNRLSKAGTDPYQLLSGLRKMGFSVYVVDPVSGEVRPAASDHSLSRLPYTLLFSRVPLIKGDCHAT